MRPDPERRSTTPERDRGQPPPWEPERWVREDHVDEHPLPAARPSRRRRSSLPPAVAEEIAKAPAGIRAPRLEQRLAEAADAFGKDRPQDAYRILKPMVERAPAVSAAQELTGLALYRLGRWKQAARHLEEFRRLTGSVEQHPVLADCYRALGRYKTVDALWDELRESTGDPELVTEGRIVAAGALADQGELRGAIALLEKGPARARKAPKVHHLRLWYALADLHERVGDTPKARELWRRVVAAEPAMADAAERLQALG